LAVTGTHIVAELLDCECNPENFTKFEDYKSFFEKKIVENDLQIVSFDIHSFIDKNTNTQTGYTGMAVLGESHLGIHTWPEFNEVHVEVFVCDYTRDNSSRAAALMEDFHQFFKPKESIVQIIKRGIQREDE
jgi:S-adenosylmethionine/arginine decarboxylase-like enzyme